MPHQVEVIYLHATDKAVLVDIDGEEVWVPSSQIHADSEVTAGVDMERGEEGTLIVSDWWARKLGLL